MAKTEVKLLLLDEHGSVVGDNGLQGGVRAVDLLQDSSTSTKGTGDMQAVTSFHVLCEVASHRPFNGHFFTPTQNLTSRLGPKGMNSLCDRGPCLPSAQETL